MKLSSRIKDIIVDDANNMTEKGHRMMTAYLLLELAQKVEDLSSQLTKSDEV